jgi:hypothetical protein
MKCVFEIRERMDSCEFKSCKEESVNRDMDKWMQGVREAYNPC